MGLHPDAHSGFVGQIKVDWTEEALMWVRHDYNERVQEYCWVKALFELHAAHCAARLGDRGVLIRFAQQLSILVYEAN